MRTFVKDSSGKRIPILFAGAILRDEGGGRIGSIGLMTDLREVAWTEWEFQIQHDFLAMLENYPQTTPINELADLKDQLTQLLDMTRKFCEVEYLVLFVSAHENDTVLQALASSGLRDEVQHKLPHFNWRKAELLSPGPNAQVILYREAELLARWAPDEAWRKRVVLGIRGEAAGFLGTVSCAVPIRLGDSYRALLLFGPFPGGRDLRRMSAFLHNVTLTISTSALGWVQTLNLRGQKRDAENAAQLIIHRVRLSLMQVTGKFGLIKHVGRRT